MILAALLAGCILSPDRKDDGGDNPPGAPAVTWISVSEGDVVHAGNITVAWKGNEHSLRYRVTLDDVSSAWIDSTSLFLSGLSNGAHTLAVQAANDSLFSEVKTVHFTVDAGAEPRIRFSPDTVSGVSFVSVSLEDMRGIMAAHIEIACGDSSARLREFTPSEAASAATVILLSDSRDPSRLILDIGFPEQKGGLTGTLELGSFVISPLKREGVIAIDPAKTVFRDSRNRTVSSVRYETLRITP